MHHRIIRVKRQGGGPRRLDRNWTLAGVFVEGKVEADRVRLSVQEVRDADAYAADAAQGVRLFIDEPSSLMPLKTILQRTERGRGLVSLVLKLDQGGGEVELEVRERYRISPSIRQSLKAVAGVLEVQEI